MLTFTVSNSDSHEDVEAFHLVAPRFGKFKSLVTLKKPGYALAETRIEFEKVALILRNLNIGYSGMGPGCMQQILVELGADKKNADKAIESHQARFHVERTNRTKNLDEREIKWSPLGGDLVVLEEDPPVIPEE
ncbi:MAG: hypothetical protein ABI036_11135 [Fibrobacteria bacterium]